MTPTQNSGEFEPLSASELADLAELLTDPDAVFKLLPEEDQREYERCRDSVIEARRYAERNAHLWWIG